MSRAPLVAFVGLPLAGLLIGYSWASWAASARTKALHERRQAEVNSAYKRCDVLINELIDDMQHFCP